MPDETPQKPEGEWEVISFAEILAMFMVIDDCNNFGVPWYAAAAAALQDGRTQVLHAAFAYLIREVNNEKLKLSGWQALDNPTPPAIQPKKTRKKKKKDGE